MPTGGLSLHQAPRLWVPALFFATIPLGVLTAGCILLVLGAAPLATPWAASALALAHAGTLGVLAMGMFGALYQMTPVVAGTPVPLVRLSGLVHAMLLAGVAGFVWRLLGGPSGAMHAAVLCLSTALVAFALPVGWALARASTRNETVYGMRLALTAFGVAALMGLAMSQGHAGAAFPGQRTLWMQLHLTLALLGWVGGLIVAVSWQVIPMFYLAGETPPAARRWSLCLLGAGLALPLAALAAEGTAGVLAATRLAAAAALPAALVVWLLHPLGTLRQIARRKRKRRDASLLYWRAGLGSALALIPLAAAAVLLADPRWQLLFGWVGIWGWAGMILHGMLSRIVPFLVWFHRHSSKAGLEPAPSMRSLLSQRRIQAGFTLHLGSVVLGVAAIALQADIAAQLTGGLLAATAITMGANLAHVLK